MKQDDLANCGYGSMRDNVIRQREELAEQIRALKGMKEMAAVYGFGHFRASKNAKKHSSGCTSDTLQQSRLRTELP